MSGKNVQRLIFFGYLDSNQQGVRKNKDIIQYVGNKYILLECIFQVLSEHDTSITLELP